MSSETLRICLLTYRGNPRSGGQGIYVRLLSRELVALGHSVEVWSGPPYPELETGIRLVEIPSLDLWKDDALLRMPSIAKLRDPVNIIEWARTMLGEFPEPRTFSERAARRLKMLAAQDVQSNGNGNGHGNGHRINGNGRRPGLPFDVVHDNQCLGPGLLKLREQVPVVATIHHPVTRDRRIALDSAPSLLKRYGLWRWYSFLPMQQRVSRQLDCVLTVSQAAASDLETDYGIERHRLRVVGNGINLDVFRPMPEIAREPNQLITTLSADVPLKGFTFLLDALAELRRDRPDLELTVIGSPMPRSKTREKITRLGLERAVHFTGRVEAEEIARAYARSSVAIVSSLYEGFGFPAGEAMACEVPVVSTRAGALPEVVGTDGESGVLVAPGDAEALARGIAVVLDATAERRRAMGEAGRRRVETFFTWRRAAELTVDGYREAIAHRARHRC
jgi:glycosyltransferase involved in cell wall biosynthesis